MKNVHLVGIDIQNCFCDPKGSLFVKGADKDSERTAAFIRRLGPKLSDISLTLDSHHYAHIAHGLFWKDRNGNHPNPFTLINVEDVENGTWRAAKPSLQGYALRYVKTLKSNGRYVLCIWPPHAIIGTPGQNIHPVVEEAVKEWCETYFGMPNFLTKGSNILTEHYSAVQADVPDANDPSTQINVEFIKTLQESDIIYLCGQASSHCVFNTLRDVVENFADPKAAQKIKVISDCMSPVPGFEALEQDLWDFCKKYSIDVIKSTEVLI